MKNVPKFRMCFVWIEWTQETEPWFIVPQLYVGIEYGAGILCMVGFDMIRKLTIYF